MLIAIDHGNYAIKTPHTAFLSGLAEHKVKPPLAEEAVESGGSYWTLSGKRLPYMRDKTRDSRFLCPHPVRYWPGIGASGLPASLRTNRPGRRPASRALWNAPGQVPPSTSAGVW